MDNPILKEDADRIIDRASDLISDRKYILWYYKKLYEIGVDKFVEIEEIARQGIHPPRRFASLLKRAKRD